jgi:hypothetical protein
MLEGATTPRQMPWCGSFHVMNYLDRGVLEIE